MPSTEYKLAEFIFQSFSDKMDDFS